ncbi:hypothetical protein RUND412_001261 [Rhizina undulata]
MESHSNTPRQLRTRNKHPIVDISSQGKPDSTAESSQGEVWCQIKEIIGERRSRYRIVWEGIDPETGLPWKPEWKKKNEITEDALADWKWRKKEKRKKKKAQRKRRKSAAVPDQKRNSTDEEEGGESSPSSQKIWEKQAESPMQVAGDNSRAIKEAGEASLANTQTSKYESSQFLNQRALEDQSSPLPPPPRSDFAGARPSLLGTEASAFNLTSTQTFFELREVPNFSREDHPKFKEDTLAGAYKLETVSSPLPGSEVETNKGLFRDPTKDLPALDRNAVIPDSRSLSETLNPTLSSPSQVSLDKGLKELRKSSLISGSSVEHTHKRDSTLPSNEDIAFKETSEYTDPPKDPSKLARSIESIEPSPNAPPPLYHNSISQGSVVTAEETMGNLSPLKKGLVESPTIEKPSDIDDRDYPTSAKPKVPSESEGVLESQERQSTDRPSAEEQPQRELTGTQVADSQRIEKKEFNNGIIATKGQGRVEEARVEPKELFATSASPRHTGSERCPVKVKLVVPGESSKVEDEESPHSVSSIPARNEVLHGEEGVSQPETPPPERFTKKGHQTFELDSSVENTSSTSNPSRELATQSEISGVRGNWHSTVEQANLPIIDLPEVDLGKSFEQDGQTVSSTGLTGAGMVGSTSRLNISFHLEENVVADPTDHLPCSVPRNASAEDFLRASLAESLHGTGDLNQTSLPKPLHPDQTDYPYQASFEHSPDTNTPLQRDESWSYLAQRRESPKSINPFLGSVTFESERRPTSDESVHQHDRGLCDVPLSISRAGLADNLNSDHRQIDSNSYHVDLPDRHLQFQKPQGFQSESPDQTRSRKRRGDHLNDWVSNTRRASTFKSPQASVHEWSRDSSTLLPPDRSLSTTLTHSTPHRPHLPELSLSEMSGNNSTPIRAALTQPLSATSALRERLERSRKVLDEKIAANRNSRFKFSPRPSECGTSRSASVSLSDKPAASGAESSVLINAPERRVSLSVPQAPLRVTPAPCALSIGTASKSQRSIQTLFGSPILGDAEFVVGLPLSVQPVDANGLNQKAVYFNAIENAIAMNRGGNQILPENSRNIDETSLRSIRDFLDEIARITVQPELVRESGKMSGRSYSTQAEYNVGISTKFAFLKDFFESARHFFTKIAIVAEPGKSIDMLETFLRGIKIPCTRLDTFNALPPPSDDEIDASIKIFLVPSTKSGANTVRMIIAMDSTFDPNLPIIKQMRSNIIEVDKLAPVIRLVTFNTIEHVRLCVSAAAEVPLVACAQAVKDLRFQAGNVEPSSYAEAMVDSPSKVSKWLSRQCEGNPDLPIIPQLSFPEPDSQKPPNGGDSGEKRKRQVSVSQGTENSVLPSPNKKVKLIEDFPASSPSMNQQSSQDITHVTDPMADQPQFQGTVLPSEDVSSPMDLEDENNDVSISEMIEVPATQEPKPRSPLAVETDIESWSHEKLILEYKKKAEQLEEYVRSMNQLSARYQERRMALVELKQEHEEIKKALQTAESRRDRAQNEAKGLQEDKIQLKADLETARNALVGGIPDIAKMEKLRAENESLNEKLRNTESKLAAEEERYEFLRELYQKATKDTAEIKSELEGLQETNVNLERLADERAVTLRKEQSNNQIKARDNEIENLKIMLHEREEHIRRLEKDKASNQKARGSIRTRSSSVPQHGSPLHSRASSPASVSVAGASKDITAHPLRNG